MKKDIKRDKEENNRLKKHAEKIEIEILEKKNVKMKKEKKEMRLK